MDPEKDYQMTDADCDAFLKALEEQARRAEEGELTVDEQIDIADAV